MKDDKIQTLHPEKGKKNKRIPAAHYKIVKQAILDVLQDEELTHTELIAELDKRLKEEFPENISWYGMTVKLDLEARAIIKRTSSKPQKYRLK